MFILNICLILVILFASRLSFASLLSQFRVNCSSIFASWHWYVLQWGVQKSEFREECIKITYIG